MRGYYHGNGYKAVDKVIQGGLVLALKHTDIQTGRNHYHSSQVEYSDLYGLNQGFRVFAQKPINRRSCYIKYYSPYFSGHEKEKDNSHSLSKYSSCNQG